MKNNKTAHIVHTDEPEITKQTQHYRRETNNMYLKRTYTETDNAPRTENNTTRNTQHHIITHKKAQQRWTHKHRTHKPEQRKPNWNRTNESRHKYK